MKGAAATEVKNRFGQMLETVASEPIAIEKKGRPVAVMMSIAEYERLVEIEDRYWGEKALKAVGEGFVSEKETRVLIEREFGTETPR